MLIQYLLDQIHMHPRNCMESFTLRVFIHEVCFHEILKVVQVSKKLKEHLPEWGGEEDGI